MFNIRFPGQYYDVESGLHYNRFRTYDPGVGRYVSADPIGQFGLVKFSTLENGFGGSANPYAYAFEDPLNFFDAGGLKVNLNLFPRDKGNIHEYADEGPATANYSVGAHGTPTSVVDAAGNPISPKDLAAMIKADPNYKTGTPVDLMSCQTGKTPVGGGDPYAKELAKELGAPVNAPDTYDFYYEGGDVKPYEGLHGSPSAPDTSKPGTVRTFTP